MMGPRFPSRMRGRRASSIRPTIPGAPSYRQEPIGHRPLPVRSCALLALGLAEHDVDEGAGYVELRRGLMPVLGADLEAVAAGREAVEAEAALRVGGGVAAAVGER